MESPDALRMNKFLCSADNSLRTFTPSRDGLTEHIKCVFLQGSYEWRTPVEDMDFVDLRHWGWRFFDNRYIPKLHDPNDTVDINYLLQKL